MQSLFKTLSLIKKSECETVSLFSKDITRVLRTRSGLKTKSMEKD
jgi:hypothetical protein